MWNAMITRKIKEVYSIWLIWIMVSSFKAIWLRVAATSTISHNIFIFHTNIILFKILLKYHHHYCWIYKNPKSDLNETLCFWVNKWIVTLVCCSMHYHILKFVQSFWFTLLSPCLASEYTKLLNFYNLNIAWIHFGMFSRLEKVGLQ